MTVTHETLHADLATVRAELASIRADDAKRAEEMAQIRARLTDGAAMFSEVKLMISEVRSGLNDIKDRQSEDRAEIKELLAAENRRQGRDGVWAAIMRSPLVAWLTAAGAGIAGFFAYIKGHGG